MSAKKMGRWRVTYQYFAARWRVSSTVVKAREQDAAGARADRWFARHTGELGLNPTRVRRDITLLDGQQQAAPRRAAPAKGGRLSAAPV